MTPEDITLQLDLSVDELVVMGATIVPSKEDLCTTLLEKVPNKFDGGRISMNWWLLHLIEFKEYKQLNSGSAVLVTLYRELCGATGLDNMQLVVACSYYSCGHNAATIFRSSSKRPIYVSVGNDDRPSNSIGPDVVARWVHNWLRSEKRRLCLCNFPVHISGHQHPPHSTPPCRH
ncbi:hypothetical protein V6Z12_D07G183600 [Gossypium hirsutum]